MCFSDVKECGVSMYRYEVCSIMKSFPRLLNHWIALVIQMTVKKDNLIDLTEIDFRYGRIIESDLLFLMVPTE